MKPILFNTEMVKAHREGRKTMTRRLIKPQPGADADLWYAYAGSRKQDIGKWHDRKSGQTWSPPYHADDILYVRETWGVYCRNWWEASYFEYRADWQAQDTSCGPTEPPKWRPSIHMPKEAARIFLRVKRVRVERLQVITDEDAIKEGCVAVPCDCANKDEHGCVDCLNTGWIETPAEAFMNLWDTTIKPADLPTYGWEANPWVWVIEYEQISKEEALK